MSCIPFDAVHVIEDEQTTTSASVRVKRYPPTEPTAEQTLKLQMSALAFWDEPEEEGYQ